MKKKQINNTGGIDNKFDWVELDGYKITVHVLSELGYEVVVAVRETGGSIHLIQITKIDEFKQD